MGKSRWATASMSRLPMPGSWNRTSMTTLPPSACAIWTPRMVTVGITAFRRACLRITRRSASPLAHAVRM